MRETARLIKAQVGVDAVAIDYGSWDVHSSLGTLDSTTLSSMNGMVGNPVSPTTPSPTVTSLSRPTTEACCAKS